MREKFIIMMKVFILLNLPITLLILYSCNSNNLTLFNYELKKIPQIEILAINDSNNKYHDNQTSFENKIVVNNSKNQHKTITFSDYQKFLKYFTYNETDFYINNLKTNQNNLITQNIAYNEAYYELLVQKKQKRKVALIGDSMGQGLSWGFEKYAEDYNIQFKSFAKQSTTTKYWYKEESLEEELKKFNPDIILISLGSNEFSGNHIHSKLNILKLKQKINQLCSNLIWILPPIEKAREYNDIVRGIFTEKKVFDSNLVELPRGKDRIHPTRNGFFQWTSIIYDCCLKNKLENPECIINGNS